MRTSALVPATTLPHICSIYKLSFLKKVIKMPKIIRGENMTFPERIMVHLQTLPAGAQAEVLHFVEYLKAKAEMEYDQEWSSFSLAKAMQDMENDPQVFSLSELQEKFQ